MTPEQKRAYANLGEAIQECMHANGYLDGTMVVTDWLVCVAQQGLDHEGESTTGIAYLVRDGDLAWHRLLGLVEAVRLRLHAVYNDDGEG